MTDVAPPQVVVVTGAAGYIGSHLCEALLRRGDAVVAVDAFTAHYDPTRKRRNLAAVEATARLVAATKHDHGARWPGGNLGVVEGDVRNQVDLDAAFELAARLAGGRRARRVVHLAARAGVRGRLDEAADYVSLNVDGATAVLEACRRHGLGDEVRGTDHARGTASAGQGRQGEVTGTLEGGRTTDPENPASAESERVGHLVLASSSTVYGSGPPGWSGPFSEDLAADRPLSVYGATKRAGELLGYAYSHLAHLRITCLRFFGVVGPRARSDLSPYAFTDAAWHGRPIAKFGDGTSARDYTYVGDIIGGVLQSLDRFERAAAGEVEPGERFECINLGNDRPVTLNDYLALLERLLGKPVLVNQAAEHPMDAWRTWADLGKARRLLGYAPTTSFETALARCVEWYVREKSAEEAWQAR